MEANALALVFPIAALCLVLERFAPGRDLPDSRGWHARAALLNTTQYAIVLVGGVTWSVWLQAPSLYHLAGTMPALAQGFLCWFVGTHLTWWDRVFGTFREAGASSPRCGYRGSREQLLGRMLAFRDVNAKPTVSDR